MQARRSQISLAFAERQVIGGAHHQTAGHVGIGRPALGAEIVRVLYRFLSAAIIAPIERGAGTQVDRAAVGKARISTDTRVIRFSKRAVMPS